MSIMAVSWVLEQSKATGAARLVLLSIANHASEDGDSCWPSIRTIAREANLSERAVQYALPSLERLGELRLERGTGRGHTHRFFLPTLKEWVQAVRSLRKRVQNP